MPLIRNAHVRRSAFCSAPTLQCSWHQCAAEKIKQRQCSSLKGNCPTASLLEMHTAAAYDKMMARFVTEALKVTTGNLAWSA